MIIQKIRLLKFVLSFKNKVNQKDILKKREKYIHNKYLDFKVIKDIGSGFDFERKGFCKIFDLITNNKINKLMLLNKTSFMTTGYEFFKKLLKKNNARLIILNKKKNSSNIYRDLCFILSFYNN